MRKTVSIQNIKHRGKGVDIVSLLKKTYKKQIAHISKKNFNDTHTLDKQNTGPLNMVKDENFRPLISSALFGT